MACSTSKIRTRIGIMALALLVSVPAGAADFEVREYGGMPCMWQNGLPYFGRFNDTDRNGHDLAGEWRFITDPQDQGEQKGYHLTDFDDSAWRTMPVPGVWNARQSDFFNYQGAAWYRRSFRVPSENTNGLVRIYLDGVIFHGKVFMNGKYLGEHSGGYTAWSVDATTAFLPGADNAIAIRVDNRRSYIDVPPKLWEAEKLGWWPYGGIARLARLEFTPVVSINKLVVRAEPGKGASGEAHVSGLVYNHGSAPMDATVRAVIPGMGTADFGEIKVRVPARDCARFEFPRKILEGVELWSNAHTKQYTLEVTADAGRGSDRVIERFGFRSFEIKGTALYLNDKPYWLRGMNRHEDDPITGLYQSPARMEEDMALLAELHVNHIRPGHYPNDPRWLDLCDRKGITITHEIPLYQASNGVLKWAEARFLKGQKQIPGFNQGYPVLKQMTDPELLSNAEQQLIEMIERDRNHPSIIMWSVGNENLTYLPRARQMYERLIGVCRRFDPERPVTFALLAGPYVSPLLEKTGELADVISVNEYYGWYFGKAEGVAGLLDRFHKKYPDKPIVVSEFGAGTVLGRHSDVPDKFSEEYQVYVFETQYRLMLERPWVAGAMPWILADFRCPWFGDEHPIHHMNLKGLVDYERNKKAAFYTVKETYAGIEESMEGESGLDY